jgi:hypothetical protein
MDDSATDPIAVEKVCAARRDPHRGRIRRVMQVAAVAEATKAAVSV